MSALDSRRAARAAGEDPLQQQMRATTAMILLKHGVKPSKQSLADLEAIKTADASDDDSGGTSGSSGDEGGGVESSDGGGAPGIDERSEGSNGVDPDNEGHCETVQDKSEGLSESSKEGDMSRQDSPRPSPGTSGKALDGVTSGSSKRKGRTEGSISGGVKGSGDANKTEGVGGSGEQPTKEAFQRPLQHAGSSGFSGCDTVNTAGQSTAPVIGAPVSCGSTKPQVSFRGILTPTLL
jgi:hypothetical protein